MLGRDQIAHVALDVLEEVGLDGLTTRRLADALQVKGPSLYHHFTDKNDLLGEMAAIILRRGLPDMTRAGDWKAWLRSLGHNSCRAVLSVRDGARVLTSAWPTEAMRKELIPALQAPLTDAGFSPPAAMLAIGTMASFVLGWAMNVQNSAVREYLASAYDLDAGFDFGVEAIVQGIALLKTTSDGTHVHTPGAYRQEAEDGNA